MCSERVLGEDSFALQLVCYLKWVSLKYSTAIITYLTLVGTLSTFVWYHLGTELLTYMTVGRAIMWATLLFMAI